MLNVALLSVKVNAASVARTDIDNASVATQSSNSLNDVSTFLVPVRDK